MIGSRSAGRASCQIAVTVLFSESVLLIDHSGAWGHAPGQGGWVPTLKFSIEISKDVERWRTVLEEIIDPKDFLLSTNPSQNTSRDPNYPSDNVYRFDYDVNAKRSDQNNKTRTFVKPIVPSEKDHLQSTGLIGAPPGTSTEYYSPAGVARGTQNGKIKVNFSKLPKGLINPGQRIIPDIKYHIKKQKLVPVTTIKIFGKRIWPFGKSQQ